MADSPLRTMRDVMSGDVTAQRIAAAEAPAKKKRKKGMREMPEQESLNFTVPQQHIDARAAAIEAQRRADEAELRRRGLLK